MNGRRHRTREFGCCALAAIAVAALFGSMRLTANADIRPETPPGGVRTVTERPRTELKVLMIGNSFSVCLLDQFPLVAKSMGLKLDLCSMYIGGCSLERHWGNVEKAGDPSFMPYKVGRNVNGKRLPDAKGNIPQILSAEKWDVVTIQQASHLSWQPGSYHPYADNLVGKIRELAPQAEIVVQETWSYTPWDRRLAQWKIDQGEMYAKLHSAYCSFAQANGFQLIPMGSAVQLYRRELPVVYSENSFGGDPCGSAKFVRGGDGRWMPKGDVFHLNREGRYLQALVWTASLYGVDVAKCPYRPDFLDAARAVKMRSCAMKSVGLASGRLMDKTPLVAP